MDGLLHLIQHGWAWAGCGPAQSLLAVQNVTGHQRPVYKLHINQCGTIITCRLPIKGLNGRFWIHSQKSGDIVDLSL